MSLQFSWLRRPARVAQQGFTLIELAIVAIFLGILAIFAISTFSSTGTSATRANALWDGSSKLADNWALITQACSVGTDVTTVDVSAGSASTVAAQNLSLLVGNAAPVAGTLTTCFNNSGVRALTSLTTGGQGAEAMQGYPLALATVLTSSGKNAMSVTFSNVPDSVVLPLYNRYSSVAAASSASSLPATANTTDPTVQFGALSSGVRTLTLVRPL